MSKTSAILDCNEKGVEDDSMKENEAVEYVPNTGVQLNNSGDIRITVESRDIYSHPVESYLLIGGRLTNTDGTAYADADMVTLINNGVVHLFDSMRYDIDGKEMETLRYPGQALIMLKALTISDDQSRAEGLSELWAKYSTTAAAATNTGFAARQAWVVQSPQEKGRFQVRTPLKEIFGFSEDLNVVYGLKEQLTLRRKADTDAIFKAAAAADGKVVLDQISWFLPVVEPNQQALSALTKQIESKSELEIDYRIPQITTFTWPLTVKAGSERPRYMIVAFQTGKKTIKLRTVVF